MKKIYEVTDEKTIHEILDTKEFGTLALCAYNIPYSVPINFARIDKDIYFHGAQKGKKLDFLEQNPHVSFSVVDEKSILPSYFSSDDENACPATHIYKSVIIDGVIEMVEEFEDKKRSLSAFMQKYQKEGGYKPFDDEVYKKAIAATKIYKLIPENISCKFKLGQNFTPERFKRVKEYLLKRGTKMDLITLKEMEMFKK